MNEWPLLSPDKLKEIKKIRENNLWRFDRFPGNLNMLFMSKNIGSNACKMIIYIKSMTVCLIVKSAVYGTTIVYRRDITKHGLNYIMAKPLTWIFADRKKK